MVVGSRGAAVASLMPEACSSVSSMRSSRRATVLLRWVALPTSARGRGCLVIFGLQIIDFGLVMGFRVSALRVLGLNV
jgi:hypothetical protein